MLIYICESRLHSSETSKDPSPGITPLYQAEVFKWSEEECAGYKPLDLLFFHSVDGIIKRAGFEKPSLIVIRNHELGNDLEFIETLDQVASVGVPVMVISAGVTTPRQQGILNHPAVVHLFYQGHISCGVTGKDGWIRRALRKMVELAEPVK